MVDFSADLKSVLHRPASNISKEIPLSNNRVQRRNDEMSDTESFQFKYLETIHSSIQLEESTSPVNEPLIFAYVVLLWISKTMNNCSSGEL